MSFVKDIRVFVKDIRVLFLLFILGDTATTIYALNTGFFYEGNPFLALIFSRYGFFSLIPIKLAFLILLYKVYTNTERPYWNITRHSVSCIGLLATVSNMAVILHG